MGLSCRSPDSWCKRFNVVNASLKSERSFNGLDLPELLREIHHFFQYRKCSAIGEIFLRKLVHLDTDLFSSIMFELGYTKFRIFQKAVVDPFEMLLDASRFQNQGLMIFFLFWSFPISVAMRSSLLNYVLWN